MNESDSCDDVKRQFRNRFLTDENSVFEQNAWDDVQWDSEQEKLALNKVKENSKKKFCEAKREEYEKNAAKFWDAFYNIHQNKFFKDRHWLFTEFPELDADKNSNKSDCKIKILEIGCGVGNTIFPILQTTSTRNTFYYACDFSKVAVTLLKENPLYNENCCFAFECDVTSENWNVPFQPNSLDIVIMIFVLSSINPEKFTHVIKQVKKYLKPNGQVLFRDYGRYDMAQLRFKDGRCITDNFYVRGDGTRVYFFAQEEVKKLFLDEGFIEEQNLVDRRLQVNRRKLLKMYRVWIQAKYRKS